VAEPQDFDLLAAQLRADLGDLDAFLTALATKLEGAFPDACEVERGGGFLRGPKRVERVTAELGDHRFTIARTRNGFEARRAHVVRGVVLKNEELPVGEWVDELARQLARVAGESERGRVALQRLLGS
jgi:hypothetical protein